MPTNEEYTRTPPQVCPADFEAGRDLLSPDVRSFLVHYMVPWSVIHLFGTTGWTTVTLFTDRFRSVDDINATAPAALNFAAGTHGFDDNMCRRALSSIKRAWMAISRLEEAQTDPAIADPRADPARLMTTGQRESLETSYETATGSKAPIEDQGSDTFLGALYKEVVRGNTGTFTPKDIVPKVPDLTTYLHTIKKRHSTLGSQPVLATAAVHLAALTITNIRRTKLISPHQPPMNLRPGRRRSRTLSAMPVRCR